MHCVRRFDCIDSLMLHKHELIIHELPQIRWKGSSGPWHELHRACITDSETGNKVVLRQPMTQTLCLELCNTKWKFQEIQAGNIPSKRCLQMQNVIWLAEGYQKLNLALEERVSGSQLICTIIMGPRYVIWSQKTKLDSIEIALPHILIARPAPSAAIS